MFILMFGLLGVPHCRGELPYLKELEEKLKGKNICFLSISCDKDVEKWKQMVKDEKLGGIM